MNSTLIIPVIVGIALLFVLYMVVAASRYRIKFVPNYRAMFIMGICFIPIGIAGIGLLPLGIILSSSRRICRPLVSPTR